MNVTSVAFSPASLFFGALQLGSDFVYSHKSIFSWPVFYHELRLSNTMIESHYQNQWSTALFCMEKDIGQDILAQAFLNSLPKHFSYRTVDSFLYYIKPYVNLRNIHSLVIIDL